MDMKAFQEGSLKGFRALRITMQNTLFLASQYYDLTFQQLTVLMELGHFPNATAGELSDHACILRSNFASVARKLEQKELIRQERSAADRRYSVLHLTEKGTALLHEIEQWMSDRFGDIFQDEPEERIEDLIRGYDAMYYFSEKLEKINRQKGL